MRRTSSISLPPPAQYKQRRLYCTPSRIHCPANHSANPTPPTTRTSCTSPRPLLLSSVIEACTGPCLHSRSAIVHRTVQVHRSHLHCTYIILVERYSRGARSSDGSCAHLRQRRPSASCAPAAIHAARAGSLTPSDAARPCASAALRAPIVRLARPSCNVVASCCTEHALVHASPEASGPVCWAGPRSAAPRCTRHIRACVALLLRGLAFPPAQRPGMPSVVLRSRAHWQGAHDWVGRWMRELGPGAASQQRQLEDTSGHAYCARAWRLAVIQFRLRRMRRAPLRTHRPAAAFFRSQYSFSVFLQLQDVENRAIRLDARAREGFTFPRTSLPAARSAFPRAWSIHAYVQRPRLQPAPFSVCELAAAPAVWLLSAFGCAGGLECVPMLRGLGRGWPAPLRAGMACSEVSFSAPRGAAGVRESYVEGRFVLRLHPGSFCDSYR
jgi:hypothetical protein